jgi:ABC-type sugar transport system substrate-binding protein
MRGFPIMVLTMMLSSAGLAQTMATPAAPSATTSTPGPAQGISRDDYIAKFRDAAEKRAATRFDAMDANHDGVLTKEEIAAYRAAHARSKPAEPQ